MGEKAKAAEWTEAKLLAVEKVVRENLVFYAGEAGVSKSDIAKGVGVSPTAVSKWFSGEHTIGLQNVKPLCDYLGIPMHALLGESSMFAKMGKTRRRVFSAMDRLDEVGQAKLLAYAEDLVATGLYDADE